MRDVIIIGSGPAGMGAAIYGKRAGLNTLVIEGTGMSGGQVTQTYEVDNYLGLPGVNGFDMAMTFQAHMEKLGAEFVTGIVTRIEKKDDRFVVITEEENYETRTVILATGAAHNKLMVPGEEELAGMGVSYCATCDGAFFKGRTTMVVGGGDVAIEDAIFLARGCEKVYLVHRRDELRGAKILQDNLMSLSNVEIIWDSVVEEIQGEEQVEQVKIRNKRVPTFPCRKAHRGQARCGIYRFRHAYPQSREEYLAQPKYHRFLYARQRQKPRELSGLLHVFQAVSRIQMPNARKRPCRQAF